MSEDDRKYRRRTPPGGYPARPPLEIDPEVTPPPLDLPPIAQLGAVWKLSGQNAKRLDILFGTQDQEGVVPAMRAAVGRLEGRIVELEKTQQAIARERDILLLRLANMEKLLEEQSRMLKALGEGMEERMTGIETKQTEAAPAGAVNRFKVNLVWGLMMVAAIALTQIAVNRFAAADPPPAASSPSHP